MGLRLLRLGPVNGRIEMGKGPHPPDESIVERNQCLSDLPINKTPSIGAIDF